MIDELPFSYYNSIILIKAGYAAMVKWFNKQSRLIQILLLLIPVVNWVVEVLVRWSAFLKSKSIITLIFAIVVTFFGIVVGWVDLVWCLLFKHLIFAKG